MYITCVYKYTVYMYKRYEIQVRSMLPVRTWLIKTHKDRNEAACGAHRAVIVR